MGQARMCVMDRTIEDCGVDMERFEALVEQNNGGAVKYGRD